MRAQFAAMSDADKSKLKARLQSQYNAMSPSQKDAFQRKLQRRAERIQARRAKAANAEPSHD
jgi:hypothetical protein